MYDPQQKVIANLHAGWRGNVQNMYHLAVETLRKTYDCKPANLMVGVSPSLGPCCAEFVHFTAEFPPSFIDFQVRPCYFDLWELARAQWLKAGILPHHIQIAGVCTACNTDDFFSYRKEKITGRNGTVIMKH